MTFKLGGEGGFGASGFVVRDGSFQAETVSRVDCRSGRHGKDMTG
jgi:hypothetical protein